MARYGKEFTDLVSIKTLKKIDMSEYFIKADLLPFMWVFKYKTDSDGYITKYKSRFIARGDL